MMKSKLRFSYIQVVIMAIALGITARIVRPKFSEAKPEEKVSILIEGLSEVRSHLDLYRACNEQSNPPTDSFENFADAITTEAGSYCPDIKEIPANPFNGLDTVRFDGLPAGADEAGWRFDTESGMFQADNNSAYSAL